MSWKKIWFRFSIFHIFLRIQGHFRSKIQKKVIILPISTEWSSQRPLAIFNPVSVGVNVHSRFSENLAKIPKKPPVLAPLISNFFKIRFRLWSLGNKNGPFSGPVRRKRLHFFLSKNSFAWIKNAFLMFLPNWSYTDSLQN